jgi:hypothetical protein
VRKDITIGYAKQEITPASTERLLELATTLKKRPPEHG